MPIPGFQELTLPLLHSIGDGHAHKHGDVVERLAVECKLDDAERKELLPSGRQERFKSRVGWAKTYLQRAGLLENAGRGLYRISAEGKRLLADPPPRLDIAYLMRYPGIAEFTGRSSNQPATSLESTKPSVEGSPEEALESSYQVLRSQLAAELLEKVKSCSPAFFERLVVDLLVAMGYGGSRRDAGRALGKSGDGGIDGIIKEDRLGLDAIYLQAKRWDSSVGRPTVQAFAGSLEGFRARKGVLLTTGTFSKEARDYVQQIEKRIVLIDGDQLAELMIDHGVGVTEVARYVVCKMDQDFFGDEG